MLDSVVILHAVAFDLPITATAHSVMHSNGNFKFPLNFSWMKKLPTV